MFARARNVSLFVAFLTAVGVAQKIHDPFALSPKAGTGMPDVAYSKGHNIYLSVWQLRSPTMVIKARRVTPGGTVLNPEISISSGPYQNYSPTVAYVHQTARFLVCWYRRPLLGGRASIVGRTINPTNGAMSSIKTIISSTEDNILPALGGDRTTDNNKAILLWNRVGKGVLATRVRVPASGTPSIYGATYVVSNAPDATMPAISRSGGSKRRWMAAFVRKTLGIQAREVFAIAIGSNSAPDGGPVKVSAGFGDDEWPSIDGNGEDFFVGWHRDQTLSKTKKDVYARALRHDGSKAVLNGSIITVAKGSLDQREPAVSFMQRKFCIAWSGEYTSSIANYHDLYFRFYGIDDAHPCGEGKVRGSGARDSDPAVASRYAGGESAGDEGIIVFASSKPQKFSDSTITAQRVEAMGNGGKVKNLGNGCGLGGMATAYSPFALGNKDFVVRLNGAGPASKVAIFNLSPVQPPLVICGSCHIMTPTVLFPVVVANGKATQPLPVPCDSKFMNMSMIFQFYVLGSRSTPCAGLDGISFSNSIQATIGF